MNEHLDKQPTDKFDLGFDMADLEEPSIETMTAFFGELEAIKQIGERKIIELGAGSSPDTLLSGGRLERTTLRAIEDPAYSGPNLNATILDGPPELLDATKDQGLGSVVEVMYTDSDKTINYTLPFGDEPTLHIERTQPISPDDDTAMDNLATDFEHEIKEGADTHALGVDKVTEGNMKKLIKAMEGARLAREKYTASQS